MRDTTEQFNARGAFHSSLHANALTETKLGPCTSTAIKNGGYGYGCRKSARPKEDGIWRGESSGAVRRRR